MKEEKFFWNWLEECLFQVEQFYKDLMKQKVHEFEELIYSAVKIGALTNSPGLEPDQIPALFIRTHNHNLTIQKFTIYF